MKIFGLYNSKPFTLLPKIKFMYAGYRGLDRGLHINWLNKIFVLVRPINERLSNE